VAFVRGVMLVGDGARGTAEGGERLGWRIVEVRGVGRCEVMIVGWLACWEDGWARERVGEGGRGRRKRTRG
jgi:hypothetical protein